MKLELTVGVYDGDDLVDTVCYVVPVEPMLLIPPLLLLAILLIRIMKALSILLISII